MKPRELCKQCVQEMVDIYKFGPNKEYYKGLLKIALEPPCPWCKR